jgi:hypothetical protein
VEWSFTSRVILSGKNSDKDLWIRRGRFHLKTRRVISIPKSEDPDWEVTHPLGGIGGLHQVVLESLFFVCRIQVKKKEEETENSDLYYVCDKQSSQCRQGDERHL